MMYVSSLTHVCHHVIILHEYNKAKGKGGRTNIITININKINKTIITKPSQNFLKNIKDEG